MVRSLHSQYFIMHTVLGERKQYFAFRTTALLYKASFSRNTLSFVIHLNKFKRTLFVTTVKKNQNKTKQNNVLEKPLNNTYLLTDSKFYPNACTLKSGIVSSFLICDLTFTIHSSLFVLWRFYYRERVHSARLPFPTHSTIAVILSRKSKISYGREKLQNILCSSYFNEFIFKK